MPLLVNDYTWTQSETTVYISVPLKGIKTSNVAVLCTDDYLKAFLFGLIDDDKSSAQIGNGAAVFTLPKKTEGLWEDLHANIEKDKKREIREEAVRKTQNKAEAQSKAKATQIREQKTYTLKTMMKLEDEERAKIQRTKDEECAKATAELEAWKEKQRKIAEEEEHKKRVQKAAIWDEKEMKQQSKNEKVYPVATARNPSRTEVQINSGKKSKTADLPPPRTSGCIQVNFTPRVFPTALRESRVAEEEEWLRKQAEARRKGNEELAKQLEDLKEEERNPDWLKEKGDQLFKAGNFQGAVNAYDLAIKINRHIPALFSNRAACHLKMRNLHKAIEDSSQALQLLTPAVADNTAARMKAHVRRGTAFCELELYVEGLQDYQAALKIDPQNQALQADAEKIREIIQSSAPAT